MAGKERGMVARSVGTRQHESYGPMDWRHVFMCWLRATPALDRIEYADILTYPTSRPSLDMVGERIGIVIRSDV